MIKYENIIYSANPPKQTNVLWIKAGNRKVKDGQDKGSGEIFPENQIIYQFINGKWQALGDIDELTYIVSTLRTEVNALNDNSVTKRECGNYASKYDQLTMPVFLVNIRNLFKDMRVGSSKTIQVPMVGSGAAPYYWADEKEYNGYGIYFNSAPYIGIQDYYTDPTVIWCKHEVGDVLTFDRERIYKSDVITSSWKNAEGVATAGTKAYLQVTIPKWSDSSSLSAEGMRKIKLQLIAAE